MKKKNKINWGETVIYLLNFILLIGEILLFTTITLWFVTTNKGYLLGLLPIWRIGFVIGVLSLYIRMIGLKTPIKENE